MVTVLVLVAVGITGREALVDVGTDVFDAVAGLPVVVVVAVADVGMDADVRVDEDVRERGSWVVWVVVEGAAGVTEDSVLVVVAGHIICAVGGSVVVEVCLRTSFGHVLDA